jgi:hypothetical protein
MPALVRSLVVGLLLLGTGCRFSHKVAVIPYLPPTSTPSLEALVADINRLGAVRSLVLRVDLQFETVEEAEEGQGRQYRTAQGRLLLARPSSIRLNIEAPILSADIAEMASNGERFQLLIHPAEYRALIEGTNGARYETETEKLDEDPELKKAGPLVNIRPQHFTEAFLIGPIDEGAGAIALLHEERAVEPDRRPGAKKDAQVSKSYSILTTGVRGEPAVTHRYWFDRAAEPRLARQQVYDRDGSLVANITYSDYLPPDPGTGLRFPSRVRIERPRDDYSLSLTVKPDGIQVNRDLPESAFVLTPPESWGESLRRIDLDERARRPSP